jgi:hypothetical protein
LGKNLRARFTTGHERDKPIIPNQTSETNGTQTVAADHPPWPRKYLYPVDPFDLVSTPLIVRTTLQPSDLTVSVVVTFSYIAHFVEVVIEPGTRRIRVPRVVSVADCGRVMSPRTAVSQVRALAPPCAKRARSIRAMAVPSTPIACFEQLRQGERHCENASYCTVPGQIFGSVYGSGPDFKLPCTWVSPASRQSAKAATGSLASPVRSGRPSGRSLRQPQVSGSSISAGLPHVFLRLYAPSSRTTIELGCKAMACEDLITACFLNDEAPLAVPELNRERTLKYLECCYSCGMSWEDVEQQIENFLQQRGVPREGIVRQLKLAKPLLQPWLE